MPTRAAILAPHPLVSVLVPKPGAPVSSIRLVAYPGTSDQKDYVRLYSSLFQLDRWVDVPEESILHVGSCPESVAPHEALYVWVRQDTPVRIPQPANMVLVEFLRDSFMTRAASTPTGELNEGSGEPQYDFLAMGDSLIEDRSRSPVREMHRWTGTGPTTPSVKIDTPGGTGGTTGGGTGSTAHE